jgi:D-alanyl-D-alanine carboxypeptidase
MRTLMWVGIACAATWLTMTRAGAEALLVIEADSGKVLYAQNAGHPWYPASVTKLMTAYVTLRAVNEGRITLDQPLTVSAMAAAQNPVKMGFPPGTIVTVDNALKMLMVKSANDMAVVLAEGVGGSIENFADQMNAAAQRLGMVQSSFVNPNGLPADDQITSARDLAILARALIRELPEYDYYWHLPGIRMGKMVQRNYNTLIGRYPGADGMKTGFICASGFNLVATATRDGKRLIAVVLGAPSSAARALKAAQLLERGFNSNTGLSWLMPASVTVDSLQPLDAAPPNMRDQMCGGHRKRPAAENEDDFVTENNGPDSPYAVFLSSLRPPTTKASAALLQDSRMGEPVLVFTGTKPPVPGAQATTEKKKTLAAKPPAAKDTQDAASAALPGDAAASKPKPKPRPPAPKDAAKDGTAATAAGASSGDVAAPKPKPKPKPAPKDAAKDGAASAAAATPSGDAAPKPKPKKPAPKAPIALTPATDQAQQSQVR